MSTVGSIIRQRRLELGLTLAEVAQSSGATKGYLSMVETGRVNNPPSTALLERIERALQLDAGQLVEQANWQSAPQSVREAMQQLAEDAKRGRALAQWLSDATSRRAGGGKNLDKLYRSGQLSRKIRESFPTPTSENQDAPQLIQQAAGTVAALSKIPLINKVTAGYPRGFTDLDYPARIADEYLTVPPGNEGDPDAFAATVIGESMLPDYREGDVVVFSPAAQVIDGCDCFARIEPEHETTFKRVFFEEEGSKVRLQPLNPKFPPQVLPREEVAGLYRAVWRMSKL